MKLAWLWGLALVTTVGFAANCGAVTLEPLPPDEPLLPEAAVPPRLMRRDAGLPSPQAPPAEEDPR